jgi:hypothetical protein
MEEENLMTKMERRGGVGKGEVCMKVTQKYVIYIGVKEENRNKNTEYITNRKPGETTPRHALS